jgi:segregation and condensation protein B
MSSSPEPPFEPQPQGISLDALAAAFAQVMDPKPRLAEDPATQTGIADSAMSAAIPNEADAVAETTGQTPTDLAGDSQNVAIAENVADDAVCPISPKSILEAMLFVGSSDNRPLSPARAAELMRGVQPDEVPALVDELNRQYASGGCPYKIVGKGDGYRLTLRAEFHALQNRFFGRVREARLSQAAIDVLAIVAYQQPITGEKVHQLRNKPSSHILAHLVRRGLLRIERPDPKRRTAHYLTTDRFLRMFNLQSMDDLPRSEDLGPL